MIHKNLLNLRKIQTNGWATMERDEMHAIVEPGDMTRYDVVCIGDAAIASCGPRQWVMVGWRGDRGAVVVTFGDDLTSYNRDVLQWLATLAIGAVAERPAVMDRYL
jgi:hypothetical protein